MLFAEVLATAWIPPCGKKVGHNRAADWWAHGLGASGMDNLGAFVCFLPTPF